MPPLLSPEVKSRREGFSLTELLVVIAILAVLAVMGFSVGRSAVETSKAAKCAGILRQLGIRIRVFAAENHGYLPANASSATKTAWWYVLYSGSEFRDFNQSMVCPSDPHPYQFKFKYQGATLMSSYRYSTQFGVHNSTGAWKPTLKSLSLATNSSTVPLVAEWNDPNQVDGASDSFVFGEDTAHLSFGRHGFGKTSNILYLDGHVGIITSAPTVKWKEWTFVPTY